MTLDEATSPEDQALALRAFPELIPKMVALRSAELRLDWLHTMIFGGLVDVDVPLAEVRDAIDFINVADAWRARIRALSTFMAGGQITADVGASMGSAGELATIDIPDGLAPLVEEAAVRIARAYSLLSSHKECTAAVRVNAELENAVTYWMAAACVIGSADAVRVLDQACPSAKSGAVPISALGGLQEFVLQEVRPQTRHADVPDDVATVGPLFCALQFSRIDCLDALYANVPSGIQLPVGSAVLHGQDEPYYMTNVNNFYASMCSNPAYAAALGYSMRPGPDGKASESRLHMVREQALESLDQPHQTRFLPVYVGMGLYRQDPTRSVRAALEGGHAAVVESLRGVLNWPELKKEFALVDPLRAAAEAALDPAASARYENTILAYQDLAAAEGFAQFTLEARPSRRGGATPSERTFEPVSTMARAGLQRAVLRYLEAGFDPRAVPDGGGRSLLDLADQEAPDMGHLIRSWQARRRVSDAIGQSGAPKGGSPTPGRD
ncbi:hypothetical protein ACSFA0_25085 [Variovorax sp. LT1P1]|uniref:hypothetical protein n=1 Tax=Variovorax sp. LT1P1 TaxID=3443730 RepID=UPI003F4558DA